jgi:uncharacterized membrane protein YqaE (UPF0057 family)
VVGIFCIHCSIDLGCCFTLGMANSNSTLPNYSICEGYGYHVINMRPVLLSFLALFITIGSHASFPVNPAKQSYKGNDQFLSQSRSSNNKKYGIRAIRKLIHRAEKEKTELALLMVLAVLLPPLSVFLKEGRINSRFWISLLLTLLFWLPGVIYSILVILSTNQA